MSRRVGRAASAAILAVLTLDAPPAQAQGMPAEAEFRFETAWNRHRQGGADNRRTQALVVIIADQPPAIRVVESGTDRDFSMTSTPDGARTRVETRRWHRRWAGERAPPSPTTQRTLTLRLEAETCTTDLRWDRAPPSRAPCPPAARTLELRCDVWRGPPGGELAGATGWRCASVPMPVSDAPRPVTLPWFIADRCIRAGRDPTGRLHVAGCPPAPGPPALEGRSDQ